MGNTIKHKLLKLGFLVATFSMIHVALAVENKVALVIGNAKYKDAPLKNPVNDAQDMKAALEKAGFTVIYAENADIDKMFDVTDKFINTLKRDSLGLFYYSGHGVQVNGENYLLPINAKIRTDGGESEFNKSLKRGAYNTSRELFSELERIGNATNVVILDACRNNPFEANTSAGAKGFSVSKGLGVEEANDSFLIAYATAPGKTASDNQKNKNSLYTKYLKQYLFEPGLTIESALKKVSKAVKQENSEQVPWYNNSIDDDVCLGSSGCSTTPSVSAPKTTYAPLLSFVSGADSVNQNKSYSVKFKATDADGDLSKILVDWGDNTTPTSKAAKNGTTLTFTHTYKFAGIQNLIATAIDKENNESEAFEKSLEVKEVAVTKPIEKPVKIPDLSATVSSQSVTRGDEITFFATLSSDLPAGYFVKINYGNGFETMNGSGKTFDLTVIPVSSAAYKIGIYDSKNILKSKQFVSNFSVSEPAPVVIVEPKPVVETPTKGDVETFVSGDRTFSYTKIANDGSELKKDAKLGTGAKDWACTKDNNTGLIWEVKTNDGGLRDKDWRYTWYEPDSSKNRGFAGYQNGNGHPEWCKESACDTYAFVNVVNSQSLCGANDWRLPTNEELRGLVVCSDGKYANLGLTELGYICSSNGAPNYTVTTTTPTINTTYFPNTGEGWFWSSSPDADFSGYAFFVDFVNGYSYTGGKSSSANVRLVRE